MQSTWQLTLIQPDKRADCPAPPHWYVLDGTLQRALSQIQRLCLEILTPQPLKVHQLLQQPAYLRLANRVYFQGYITAVVHHPSQAPTPNQRYRIVLHDALYFLQLQHSTQVIRMHTSSQITQQLSRTVLPSAASIRWQMPAHSQPGIRPWVWQWQESRLSLCQRLWAAENWYALQIQPSPASIKHAASLNHYQLINFEQWKQQPAAAETVSLFCSNNLHNLQHKGRYFHQMQVHYAQSFTANSCHTSIRAHSPQLDWQLGECLTLDQQTLHSAYGHNTTHLCRTTWIISALTYPSLHPNLETKASYCQITLKPLDNFKQTQNATWPSTFNLLAATVVKPPDHEPATVSTTTHNQSAAVNGGYYAIRYDIEKSPQQPTKPIRPAADTSGKQALPFVPLLLEQYTPACNPTDKTIHGVNTDISSQQPQLCAGSRVLIKMIEGDLSQPMIVGCQSSPQQPSVCNMQNPQHSILRSPHGETLLINNQPETAHVALNNAEQQIIKLNACTHSAQPHTSKLQTAGSGQSDTASVDTSNISNISGISIHNKQGDIIQKSQSYSSNSQQLEIQAKHINYHAGTDINIHSKQGNMLWDAKSITQHASGHIKLHSQNNIHIQAKNITLQVKQAIHITSHRGDIDFFIGGELTIQQKTGVYCAQKTLSMGNYSCQLQINPASILLTGNRITLQAGNLQVSGA